MNMIKMFRYIMIGVIVIMLSACSSKSGGDATTTPSDTNTTKTVITKVADFINGGTAPTLADYTNAGVTGVTATNIDELNALIATKTSTDVDTVAKIQAIVALLGGSSDTNATQAVITKIADFINNTGVAPSVEDYTTLGISSVTSQNINQINSSILQKTASEVDSVAKIEAIIDTLLNLSDTIKPLIVLIGNSTVVVYQGNSYADAGAVVTDNVDANRTIYSSDSVDTTVVASYTLRYDANDSANNSAIQVTRTVNVVDISTPTIIITDDTNTTEYASTYTDAGAIALDGAGKLIDVVTTGANFDTTILGEHNVTYTSKNASGIESTAIRTVTVVDTTAPIITINGDINMTIPQGEDTYVEYKASIRESVDSDMLVVISGEINSSQIGTYTISYNLTDRSGNIAEEQNRTVNVTDQTPPTITIDGNTTYYNDHNVSYSDMGAFFIDNVDADSKIYINGVVNQNSLGSYILQYNATDNAGNKALEQNRTVIVVDRVAPVISIIGGDEINTTYGIPYTDANATFSDNVDSVADLTIIITDDVNVDTIGDYNVTYFARDKSDNNTTKIRTVNVIDDTPPVITLKGDETINIVEGESYIEYNATADDDHDGNISSSIVITSDMSINPPTEGNYTIFYNVTDSTGNSADEVNRTVVVAQNNAPTITAKDINLTEGDKIDTNSSGIDVNATDIDGTISRYIFKENNTTIYEYNGSTLPSSILPLSIGEHNLTIRVIDNYDLNSTEMNITVIVKIGYTNLRKTGQTKSTYPATKYDDGYYEYGGVDRNYTADTLGGHPIIRDNLTGMMWDNDTGTEGLTKQYWSTVVDASAVASDNVCQYVLGSGTSWRVPTRKEMIVLVEYAKTPSTIDSNFTTYSSSQFWTRTEDKNNVGNAFIIDLGYAETKSVANSDDPLNMYLFHCINDDNATTPKDANFTRTADGTVIDYNTMLEWQDEYNVSGHNSDVADSNWTEALNYCHDLNLSENGIDWRVPNVRELLSIVDDNKTTATIDGNFTKTDTTTNDGNYWTSTTYISGTTRAYKVSFATGEVSTNGFKDIDTNNIRCVRTRREASFYQ